MKRWKRILTAVLTGTMTAALAAAAPVWASVDLEAVYGISTNDIQGWPKGPEISSDTGIIMEAETGVVLYDKGADELRYPASITKLMTLLVAVENVGLDETVTFTETGVRDVTPDSGNIGMQLGETMSMRDCVYAMIIYSANEVAAQIAEYVGGTEQDFIDMMNERAAEIGCTNTHFANASGLPDPNQYTTARDMALIFREGLKNSTFREIVGTPTYIIKPTNMNSSERKMHTHHPLFAEEAPLYYEGCIGGKTGMTNDAGHTLVTGVERDGVTYIAVVMRASELSPACLDSRAMFDYAYQNFRKEEFEGSKVILPNGTNADALTSKVENIKGKDMECFYLSDHLVGMGSLVLPSPTPEVQDEVEEIGDAQDEPLYRDAEEEKDSADNGQEKKSLSDTAKLLFAVMGVMAAVLVVLLIALSVKKRKQRKYKQKRGQRHGKN
ncbi:MAG: D-alanyl-D-alanine carboxypeptidase family protein [Eubacteriales bacterium]|nr:D-alanyl-D-alanine carboxypeptidase family protein [Eubacteriales bacterium]